MAHRFCVWHFIATINHCCVLAEEEVTVVTPALTVYLVKDTVKDTMAGITCVWFAHCLLQFTLMGGYCIIVVVVCVYLLCGYIWCSLNHKQIPHTVMF